MDTNRLLPESLNQHTMQLLNCNDDVWQMKHAVDQLYRVFSTITGVTIDQLNEHRDLILPSGKAISCAGAAHCLLEMKRTAVFLRGINKAITLKLTEVASKPIRILYAGTGPYGMLVIPLLPLYQPDELIVDLLDINPDSLAALQKLTGTLDLNDYIGEIYCTDATTFTIDKQYDIVISETMLACLKSEPQVAIMQNLIPQLADDCIFIPEQISIDASLVNPKMEMDRLMYYKNGKLPFMRISLGNVFTVNKQKLDSTQFRKTLSIPDIADIFPILKLFTTVKVYGKEILAENDSSITLPQQYHDFRREQAKEIEFLYVQGEKPRIESRIKQPVNQLDKIM
jgi:hypothetical protein